MIILFKYCADVKNCERFRGFGYIYIYIYIYLYIDNILTNFFKELTKYKMTINCI